MIFNFLTYFLCTVIVLSPYLLVPAQAKAETEAAPGATVLIYHRFGEKQYPSTNVSLERFREQLEYLKTNHYRVIPLQQLVEHLQNRTRLPERSVVITIDDGYRSIYDHAWPLLQEYGYPFTVFLYVKATQNQHWNYLTWDQVRRMQAAGVDFQNHGYAHAHMAFKPSGMNDGDYRTWIREDLARSTSVFTEELHEKPRFFAVPYGEYNQLLLDEIRSYGYEAIFLQDPGSVSSFTDHFAIPREPILGQDWSTLDHFQTVLERTDLPLAGEFPPPGWLESTTPEMFGAELLHADRYIPGTLGIYVSELGWQQADLDKSFVKIANTRTLGRSINRVAVSGREKKSGKTAIRYWMLVQDSAEQRSNPF